MKRVKILYRVYLFLLTKSFINIVVMLKFLRELRIFVVGFFFFSLNVDRETRIIFFEN